MNNAIAYVAPNNKMIAHIIILNNKISCVVGISIFGFNKHRKTVFNLIELNIIPTLKHFLQAEKFNAEKKKSYYQRYYVEIIRVLHNGQL